MNKTAKVLTAIALSLLIFIFFLPRFFSSMAREFLHKQFPQVEITIGDLTLGWFSLDGKEITLKLKQYKEDTLKIKRIHISFIPWELPQKKVGDIVIDGIELTSLSGDILSIVKSFQNASPPPQAVKISREPSSSMSKPNTPFSFKTFKLENLYLETKIGHDTYKAIIESEFNPLGNGIKGQIKTEITTPYGLLEGSGTFVAQNKITADISLKAKEIHYEVLKIESPMLTLKIENQPYDQLKGLLTTDAAAITYEYATQGIKIPLRLPKEHLSGPIQIATLPPKKVSFQLAGELGSVPLDLKGHYTIDIQSGHVDLKPIKVPLKASWLQGILPHIASVPGLDLKTLDGALTLHSSVDIVKGVITPHYTIKADTGKVVTAVLENALKGTLENTVMLPEKTVEAVGGLLGKLFS